jgi:hypothetical protein
MGELYYPRPMTSMFQNYPSLKFFFGLATLLFRGQSNFEFEYLGEFVTEFENILGYESGAQVCSFDGEKRKSKISCYSPFNRLYIGLWHTMDCMPFYFYILDKVIHFSLVDSIHCWVSEPY